jgi:RNA polymerase sigma-70 factor, ECF subfamily
MRGNVANELMTSRCWQESDSTLVAGTKKGDERKFEALVSRHKGRVFAMAYRITRNREDAQDVVQQSFHKAFMHLDTFEGKSAFSTWLARIAINEALMYLRKNRAVNEISLEDVASETESLRLQIPDNGKSPAEVYEQNEKKRILFRAIRRLSLESRTALLLRLEDRSIEEAADILEVESGTLKARLFRAREKLRLLLPPGLEFQRKPTVAS